MTGNLQLGWYLDHPEKVVEIAPQDIAQHTAILAQSGAGKSFFLGRLVEEILLKTKARVIVLDANGDFRKVHETDSRAWEPTHLPGGDYENEDGFRDDWRERVRKLHFINSEAGGETNSGVKRAPLGFGWHDLAGQTACTVLGLDPHREATEAELLAQALIVCKAGAEGQDKERFYSIGDCIDQVNETAERLDAKRPGAGFHAAASRLIMALVTVGDWPLWLQTEKKADEAPDLGSYLVGRWLWDLLALDLPSAGDRRAQLTVAHLLLEYLWSWVGEDWEKATAAEKDVRVPTLVVIDEAHNFAPRDATDPLAERVASDIHRIAAEGRKYGLFLVLATQRPAKVREGLLAECENVCLLRLQSPVDHRTAADTWGVPLEEVARTRHFKQGDGLLFGRWVPSATAFHAARRRTREGGASLDSDHWAQPRIEVDDGDTNAPDES